MGSPQAEAGEDSALHLLLRRLQRDSGADLVLVGECLAEPVMRVRSLCCSIDARWEPTFSYVLATHPCQQVLASGQFELVEDIAAGFPQAYLASDNAMRAYAGVPVRFDANGAHGVLLLMGRAGLAPATLLRPLLEAARAQLGASADSLREELVALRRRGQEALREAFFGEFVLDNPSGVAFSEYMPPVPLDLPGPALLQRLMYTGYVVECNRAIARMFGFADIAAMVGQRPIDINGPQKCPRVVDYWMRHGFEVRDVESQGVDADGQISWTLGSAVGTQVGNKLTHFWTKRSDITAQKRSVAALQHKVEHDALTGLPNRYWFQDRLGALIEDHRARGKHLCLGLLDLNGFKEVNDTLGHAVGDLILQAVAARMLKGLRPHGAELARLGGDEFAILMPEVSERASAEAMAATLQRLLCAPFQVEDMQLVIGGGSMGLVMYPDLSEGGDDLLRLADVAMYSAKGEAEAFRWYQPEIDKYSRRRLALFTSLGPAIGQGQLFLEYQPKIVLASGALAGFEALVRWRHPLHGRIAPNDFIPFAETSELIRPLTRWVLDAALAQAALWQRAGHPLTMAVNISARNLLDEGLSGFIGECLARHGVAAGLLELEITESALMTRPAQSMAMLQLLRAQGIAISIDDFGTGYSSLAYLARLPVTSLKVDQGFVSKMLVSAPDEQIVRSVIGLAHQCRLSVVAEGVEDAPTLAALSAMGCDLAQGYLIARPMQADQAGAWIAAHRPGAD
ncbi:MAG: EAL domain-containing protein [Pseudomonadota bacterium]